MYQDCHLPFWSSLVLLESLAVNQNGTDLWAVIYVLCWIFAPCWVWAQCEARPLTLAVESYVACAKLFFFKCETYEKSFLVNAVSNS